MQGPVDGKEEIIDAAVDDQFQLTVVQAIDRGDDGMGVPFGFMGVVFAEVFFYPPVIGKGAKVYSTAGGPCGAEEVFVVYGQVECAVPAHAETGDGAMGPVGGSGIVGVDIGDQFPGHKSLISYGWIQGAVKVPAVVAAVGTDEEDAEGISVLCQLGRRRWPLGVAAAVAVEQIDDGPMGAGIAFRADHDAFNIL